MRVRVAAAGDDLEDKDAVAEDVRLGREDAVQGVLRRHVSAAILEDVQHAFSETGGARQAKIDAVDLLCSGNAAGVSHAGVDAEQLGQAEVGDLGVHVRVQQDVAGLEVAVDDGQPRVLVEVEEPAADALDDPLPQSPAQLLPP
jgi:hypothetical protein